MRSAVMMFRDVLWKEMDSTEETGFRPDQLQVLFGGWSAGAYGTIYNYHWFLDDLQWPKTIQFSQMQEWLYIMVKHWVFWDWVY